MQVAEQNGWAVRDFEIDDGCYEIEGRDLNGREIEVKLDPTTLQIVEMEYEDDDDDAAVALAIPRPPALSPRRRTASSGTAPRRRFK